MPRHIKLLNRKLVDLVNGKHEGLIICMPPRHGKSELCSKYLPAWFLCRHPDKRVIMVSSESTLAADFGNKARDLVDRIGPQLFGVKVSSSSKAKDHWTIHGRDGGMHTAGVMGSIVGRGSHLFIVDDMIKNHEQALSETWRKKAWELWMSVIETRAEPGCGYVVINTRWHEDDVAGRLMKEIKSGTRKNWEVIELPAIAEENDLLGRAPGEALWPERWSKEWLDTKRNRWDSDEARLGPFWWHAVYQQHPTPRGGGDFQREWFRYFDIEQDGNEEVFVLDRGADLDEGKRFKKYRRSDCYCVASFDPAISEKEYADFSCLGLWYVTPDADLLLYSLMRAHLKAHEQIREIDRVSREFSPVFTAIETYAFQLSLFQDAVIQGINAKESRLPGDKRARAQLAATRFASGSIFLRRHAPWLTAYEDELVVFPNGRNDDQVDMTSIAVNELSACVVPQVY